MCIENLKCVALAVPGIIVIGVLVGGCEPQSKRIGGRRGSWMVPYERALVTSYRPSIVTFPLSQRVLEILLLIVLQHATFSHPTSSLPKFLHIPLGVGG